MAFEVGDAIKVVANNYPTGNDYTGETGKIVEVQHPPYYVAQLTDSGVVPFQESELSVITADGTDDSNAS